MIYLAGDLQGAEAIKIAADFLRSQNIDFENVGAKPDDKKDIPLQNLIPPVVKKILANENNLGILSCGSGIGVEIGANKFAGIRACLATNEKIAEWARIYDKCNTLCLVGWNPEKEIIENIIDAFLKAKYDGSKKRLKMFEEFNKWH